MHSKSPLFQRPDYVVCTCMAVMYSDLVQSIQNGCDTYEKLQEVWLVGTGCNSCVDEVHEILKQELTGKSKNN